MHRSGFIQRTHMCVWATVVALVAGCGGGNDSGSTNTAPQPAQPTTSTAAAGETVRLVNVAEGLRDPVQTLPMADGSRILVAEQAGRILMIDGARQRSVILDVRRSTSSGGERGLLALALDPKWPQAPFLYVHRSDARGDTLVERYRFSGDPIDPASAEKLLSVAQPYANHNGGALEFGRDGKLYLGLGDGGSANDPQGNAQNMDSRLGKLLRMDIASRTWEIAALGLRNPWRFRIDPETGDMWIGDVGQNRFEEIDVFPAGSGLLNFGWDVYEAETKVDGDLAAPLNPAGALTRPVAAYDHDQGCSVTGGVVVRDPTLAYLRDRYVFGDYCSGTIWSIPLDGPSPRTLRTEPVRVNDVASFDSSADGTVYVTSRRGTVDRLAAR